MCTRLASQARSISRRIRATRDRGMNLGCVEGREHLSGFSYAGFSNAGGLSLLGSASIASSNQG